MDFLDGGGLVLQYNRNRYYSQSLGRWMSEDPLGINPAGEFVRNPFGVYGQYRDGVNVYEYVSGNNIINSDAFGLMTDYEFAREFFAHWALGEGRLFTQGAEVLKRKDTVRYPVQQDLEHCARVYCRRMKERGQKEDSGSVDRVLYGMLVQDTQWMLLTLNGAHRFDIKGTYEAKRECGTCEVYFYVRHTWYDRGDLNLNNRLDQITWVTTRGYIPVAMFHYLGMYQDFPIEISWASSTILTSTTENDPMNFIGRGWPYK